MSRKVHVQYRGIAAYIDRSNPTDYFEWLDSVDKMQDSDAPHVNDFVDIHQYRNREDSSGRITATGCDGRDNTIYHVSSMNQPFCGSINGWFERHEFTIQPRD